MTQAGHHRYMAMAVLIAIVVILGWAVCDGDVAYRTVGGAGYTGKSQLDGGSAQFPWTVTFQDRLQVMPVAIFSPTPTPSGRWVYYKTGGCTFYEETGNLTALGEEYHTGPMDSLAAVAGADRWLLDKWLLVKWDGGELVVRAGDLCGKCAEYGVAVDLSPGLYARKNPPPVVEVWWWDEG